MAIGITVESANFEAFKSSVLNYAKEKHIEDIVPVLNIDEKLQLKDITMKDVRDFSTSFIFSILRPLNLVQEDILGHFMPLFSVFS